MKRRTIETDRAPRAIGPYAQGVVGGGLLFTAMQIALDPTTGNLVGASAPEQAARCLENVRGIVEAAGGTLDAVIKTTVYLRDIADFAAVNEVYAHYFTSDLPSRGVIGVSALPRGALVAVEAVAVVG